MSAICPLSGVKRTSLRYDATSAFDPNRTSLRRREYGMIRAYALRGRVTFIYDPVNPVVPAYMHELGSAASGF